MKILVKLKQKKLVYFFLSRKASIFIKNKNIFNLPKKKKKLI